MFQHFYSKTDLIFGHESIKALPEVIKAFKNEKIMMIYDEGVEKAGIIKSVTEVIKDLPISVVTYGRVLPNPTNEQVEEVAEIARREAVNLFIAIGGGSSIDLTKAVSILMKNPLPIGQYGGIGNVPEEGLPVIAIPTTAGTSSEITNVVALTDTKKVCKYVIIDDKIVPTKVIVDPSLTLTMPLSVTAATGMDAITHAVESYISNMANKLTAYHSLEALKICFENLPIVCNDGKHIVAREKMMLGCVIAGFGFSNANLGLVHGIAHTLSAHFHLPHGMANASVLPYVMTYNAPRCPEKMIEMAKVLNLPLSGEQSKDQYVLSDALLKLCRTIGIKTLSEQGIEKSHFSMLAEEVMNEPVLQFNPRQDITKEDVMSILEKAY